MSYCIINETSYKIDGFMATTPKQSKKDLKKCFEQGKKDLIDNYMESIKNVESINFDKFLERKQKGFKCTVKDLIKQYKGIKH